MQLQRVCYSPPAQLAACIVITAMVSFQDTLTQFAEREKQVCPFYMAYQPLPQNNRDGLPFAAGFSNRRFVGHGLH